MYNTQIRIMSIMLQDQISKNPKLAKEIGIKGKTKIIKKSRDDRRK